MVAESVGRTEQSKLPGRIDATLVASRLCGLLERIREPDLDLEVRGAVAIIGVD